MSLISFQEKSLIFNKATIMNIGFEQVSRLGDFDCYIFHDVDMIPEDDRNLYTCSNQYVKHLGAYCDKFDYQ